MRITVTVDCDGQEQEFSQSIPDGLSVEIIHLIALGMLFEHHYSHDCDWSVQVK